MSELAKSIESKMPIPAPLEMPTQDLSRPFIDQNAPLPMSDQNAVIFRLGTFLPAIAITLILVVIFADWFSPSGFITGEIFIMALVGFSGFWISLSVASSCLGLVAKRRPTREAKSKGEKIALLVPVYNEDTSAVLDRVSSMQKQLSCINSEHNFAFFILSDTQNSDVAKREREVFLTNNTQHPTVPVYYRRREMNLERKTGNIRNWVENWGADWNAFITLDADSLMGAQTIHKLADDISARPDAGLIQTIPKLIRGQSTFARMQQFANNIYGDVLATGLQRWSGNEGNYWGHNAIIRTRAFAQSAGLPTLSGSGALGGTIKSHDFVEAALLRRAGWSVLLRPTLEQTYEETPQTFVNYVLRDRRWCQGNLQHLRLVATSGLHPISRFHLIQGAMAYIASVAWFALLIVWTLMGRSENESVFRYFTDTNPLFPQWPHMDAVSRTFILCFMLTMLLTPKILGLASQLYKDPKCKKLGGRLVFLVSALSEITLSIIIAPVLMIQHVLSVARTIIGRDTGWAPQDRGNNVLGWIDLLRFHWLETVVGYLLAVGILAGVVTLWLLPIAVSLILAVPLSWILSRPLPTTGIWHKFLATSEVIAPSDIIKQAYKPVNFPNKLPKPPSELAKTNAKPA